MSVIRGSAFVACGLLASMAEVWNARRTVGWHWSCFGVVCWGWERKIVRRGELRRRAMGEGRRGGIARITEESRESVVTQEMVMKAAQNRQRGEVENCCRGATYARLILARVNQRLKYDICLLTLMRVSLVNNRQRFGGLSIIELFLP